MSAVERPMDSFEEAERERLFSAALGLTRDAWSFEQVQMLHWNTRLQETDEQLAEALRLGDAQYPGDPRWAPPPWEHTIETDPETEAVFEQAQQGCATDDELNSDVGNAARFVRLHAGQVRYVAKWGKWLVYDGRVWQVDYHEALVTELAKAVGKEMLDDALEVTDPDERGRAVKEALQRQSARVIKDMLHLVRGHERILLDHRDLDTYGHLLTCRNGVVNLNTGQLMEHSPMYLSTKLCDVDYDPHATAPLWEQCLATWQPDGDVLSYVQRVAGSGIIGVHVEALVINIGTGANGKSKFWGAVQDVLGDDLAVRMDKSLLVAQKHKEHATVIARLHGARLAMAAETERSATLNEAQIKDLTGGDRLEARRMREDPWAFDPTHTVVLHTNALPNVVGTDDGIWRRLRVVPWDVTIPEKDRDQSLGDRLRAERAGILAWLVRGAQAYYQRGLDEPEVVRAATAQYREDSDTVGAFFVYLSASWGARYKTATTDLMDAHRGYCDAMGLDADSHWKLVTEELRARGCTPGKSNGRRMWKGIEADPQR